MEARRLCPHPTAGRNTEYYAQDRGPWWVDYVRLCIEAVTS